MISAPAILVALLLHPNSLSSSRLVVDHDQVSLTMRCQVLSLLEVIPDLDADGNGAVDALEVEEHEQAIFDYVRSNYRLFAETVRDEPGGSPLTPELLLISFDPGEVYAGNPFPMGRVDINLEYLHSSKVEDVGVHSTLFVDTSPDHVDICHVSWDGDAETTFALDANRSWCRSAPSGRGAFFVFARLGTEHILAGWDHLAFLMALLLSAAGLRAVMLVVTAFTVSHSVTLALSAMDLVDFSTHAPLIEALIALSIAYVAVDHIVHREATRTRWIEAFAFGLIHGLGFAGFLRESLVGEGTRGWALFSFNVGVEFGQILVVLTAVLVLRIALRGRVDPNPFLAPLAVRMIGSALVAAMGFYWFADRVL